MSFPKLVRKGGEQIFGTFATFLGLLCSVAYSFTLVKPQRTQVKSSHAGVNQITPDTDKYPEKVLAQIKLRKVRIIPRTALAYGQIRVKGIQVQQG
ncbi:MAG: hypothetical protein LPD71_08395 [Shewanella sp.]|nr:hypothetical protein [Shewanella sp.]MCF1458619.1 hypothetical protein [Shewanella sp.]